MKKSATALALTLALGACAPATPSASGPPSPADVEAFKADSVRFFAAMKLCDDAAEAAKATTGKGNMYAAYPAITRAEAACNSTQQDLAAFKWSGPAPRSSKLDEASQTCAEAYGTRALNMQAAAAVVNGDMSPKAVTAASDAAALADAQVTACVAALFDKATAAGFDPKVMAAPPAS